MPKFFPKVLAIGLFLLLFFGFFHTITAITQDLGRHLLTGKLIISTREVPKVNLFSYTYPLFPFVNHHWFSEVIFYLLYKISGFDGLLVSAVIIILISFTGIFLYAWKRYSINAITISALFYFPILFERTDIRPEIFSFLLLSLFIIILSSFREKYTGWIFFLIPLELLWVNLHIYFPIGIAVLGIFLLDAIISHIVFFFSGKKLLLNHILGDKKNVTLVVVLLSCCFITLFNPNGFSGAIYPFRVFQNYGYSIEENQNIFFLESFYPHETILYFIISVILLFLFLIISFKRTRVVDWLLAIFFTYLGISAIRNFPLFVFGTFLIFCNVISGVEKSGVNILARHYSKKKINIALFILLFIAIILQSKHILSKKDFGFGVVTGASRGADFFLKHHLSGPMFNNFDIGSYVEYRMYPREKVFVDGRPEAYPQKFFQQVYIPMQNDPNIFKMVDDKYHFNTIFFSYTDQTPWAAAFLKQITQNNDWKLVYIDDFVVILVKYNTKNEKIIKQFGMDRNNIHISYTRSMKLQQLINLAYFFNTAGFNSEEELMYQSILQIDEYNCLALRNLTLLYENENNPAAASYIARARTFCPQ